MSDTSYHLDQTYATQPARTSPSSDASLASGWWILLFAGIGAVSWYWIIAGLLSLLN
ncbi:hypothetical protein [Roseovarius aquimarinus]|uniref:Uncharacterized protein n=1 Tax=Roseovarius aquimarinus TaxID=1229156 RepID=A0ABW7I5A6_9RHOB